MLWVLIFISSFLIIVSKSEMSCRQSAGIIFVAQVSIFFFLSQGCFCCTYIGSSAHLDILAEFLINWTELSRNFGFGSTFSRRLVLIGAIIIFAIVKLAFNLEIVSEIIIKDISVHTRPSISSDSIINAMNFGDLRSLKSSLRSVSCIGYLPTSHSTFFKSD